MTVLFERWRRFAAAMARDETLLILRITALLLLLHLFADRHDPLAAAASTWLAAGLVWRGVLGCSATWFAMAGALGWRLWNDEHVLDNHVYLASYWCVALGVSLVAPLTTQRELLRRNAKLLLALTMAFAVAAKLRSSSYVNASMFHFLLVSDSRFHDVGRLLAGLTDQDIARNLEVFTEVQDPLGPLEASSLRLSGSPALHGVAQVLTWWTLLVEAVLALAFLLPSRHRLASLGHAALLLFCASAYVVAPVEGFGLLLLVLGLAACSQEHHRWLPAYAACLALVQLCSMQVLRYYR